MLRWYFLYNLLRKHTKYISTRLEKVLSLITFLSTMNAKTDSFSVWKKQHSLYPIPPSPDLSYIESGILLQLINYSFSSYSEWEYNFLITDLYQTHLLGFAEHLEPIHLAATELKLVLICVLLQFLFHKCELKIQFAWFELNMQTWKPAHVTSLWKELNFSTGKVNFRQNTHPCFWFLD